MMMMDGCDHNENKEKCGTQLVMDGEDEAGHVRVLSVELLRAGWTSKDVVYSLDLHNVVHNDNDDDGDKEHGMFSYVEEKPCLELKRPKSCCIVDDDHHQDISIKRLIQVQTVEV
ncbi:hypothetical protein CRYUN_Cryun24cG0048000 [Craigia yunnanensis]